MLEICEIKSNWIVINKKFQSIQIWIKGKCVSNFKIEKLNNKVKVIHHIDLELDVFVEV